MVEEQQQKQTYKHITISFCHSNQKTLKNNINDKVAHLIKQHKKCNYDNVCSFNTEI